MVTIYAKDFKNFEFADWEDMFTQPECAPKSDWEGWKEGTQVEFELEDGLGTRALPEKRFLFDMQGEREAPFEWSKELTELVEDIVYLRPLASKLYQACNNISDTLLDDGVNAAADVFSEHYDGALGRAMLRMLAELQGVADEYPLAAE